MIWPILSKGELVLFSLPWQSGTLNIPYSADQIFSRATIHAYSNGRCEGKKWQAFFSHLNVTSCVLTCTYKIIQPTLYSNPALSEINQLWRLQFVVWVLPVYSSFASFVQSCCPILAAIVMQCATPLLSRIIRNSHFLVGHKAGAVFPLYKSRKASVPGNDVCSSVWRREVEGGRRNNMSDIQLANGTTLSEAVGTARPLLPLTKLSPPALYAFT